MASKLTSGDISEITNQSDLISKHVRDNFTNLKNKTNEVIDDLAAVSIGTTNAETTAARPYHTSLKERLDSIQSGQYPYVKTGGVVTESTPNAMTVDVAAGEAKINGIDVKWPALTSGSVSAPITYNQYAIVVATTSGLPTIVTTVETANPVYPGLASTQMPLAIITLTPGMTTITNSDIIDARGQGCIYWEEGRHKYQWKIQDAIDDLSSGGNIFIGNGIYRETLTYDDNQLLVFSGNAVLKNPVGGSTINFKDIDISTKSNSSIKWNYGFNSSDNIETIGINSSEINTATLSATGVISTTSSASPAVNVPNGTTITKNLSVNSGTTGITGTMLPVNVSSDLYDHWEVSTNGHAWIYSIGSIRVVYMTINWNDASAPESTITTSLTDISLLPGSAGTQLLAVTWPSDVASTDCIAGITETGAITLQGTWPNTTKTIVIHGLYQI